MGLQGGKGVELDYNGVEFWDQISCVLGVLLCVGVCVANMGVICMELCHVVS